MKNNKTKSYNHISLNDVKSHLRINQDFIDDDQYLLTLIKTATKIAENYINDDIALTLTSIHDYDFTGDEYIIHSSSIITLSGITGNTTPITEYSLYYFYNYSLVKFDKQIDVDDLYIIYNSGYDSNTIPSEIKHAILIKIAELYDVDRQGFVNNSIKATNAFNSLLDSYKLLF